MNTIQNLFQQAQLAEAAYANFFDTSGNLITTDAGVKAALIAAGFSSDPNSPTQSAQAAAFVTQWRVVDQYTAPSFLGLTGSGFSATVFESLDHPGQYSFAMRGTQPGYADLSADLGDILADGIALDQVVDMYNYWQSLTHSGVYQATKLETSLMETAALNLLLPGAARDAAIAALKASGAILDSALGGLTIQVRRIVKGDSSILLADTPLATGSGVLAGTASVSVAGHSLGGHLAMAFSRLFPSATVDAVAVNGAGFDFADSNVNALFAALGGAPGFDAGKITNVVGSAATELKGSASQYFWSSHAKAKWVKAKWVSFAFNFEPSCHVAHALTRQKSRSTSCSAESIANRVSLPKRTITATSTGSRNRPAIGTAPFMLMR